MMAGWPTVRSNPCRRSSECASSVSTTPLASDSIQPGKYDPTISTLGLRLQPSAATALSDKITNTIEREGLLTDELQASWDSPAADRRSRNPAPPHSASIVRASAR